MELERLEFPLLLKTLKYLDNEVTGKVINVVKSKNKFIFHVSIPICEQINDDDINLALLNENVVPWSEVQPGVLLGCLHPEYKKFVRCYVVSILHKFANVALCDTGEMTKTKSLRYLPDRYKNIPVITFEADLVCVSPPEKLRHLLENFKDYVASFESFKSEMSIETHKKMKLICNLITIDFIIKKWDPQNCLNTDDSNYNSLMFKNGSAVVIAKPENYDWRHIFVRSIDQFVSVCNKLQTYCTNALNIQKNLTVGDVVAVKCVDKFYRGRIIDILDKLTYYLYLIDSGYVITAPIDCLVDLPDNLKKVPPTVCLVGLKGITLKPWTKKTSSYINTLFENSTTMVLEYTDFDSFGLDSVTLTNINNNEDVNERLKKLQDYFDDHHINEYDSLNPHFDLNPFKHLQSKTIHPVKVENLVKSDSPIIMTGLSETSLLPGCAVYMCGYESLNVIYVRKLEDHNDEFDALLDAVHNFCLSATPITRPLLIGEIVGAKSTLDDSHYRGKVLKQIDNTTFLIQFIDFGDKDNIPISNIFEIPQNFMSPLSNIHKITLKEVRPCPLNDDTSIYFTNLLSNYEPMIIDFSPSDSLKNVTLTIVNNNENVNEKLIQLINESPSVPLLEVPFQCTPDNVNVQERYSDNILPKLKNGDSVYIALFVNVHKVFVRKVEDDTDELYAFLDKVNQFCSEETPIGKLPKLNDVIGAKSIDGSFYRAKVIKKLSDVSYNVQLIDYGSEEIVNLSNIVSLSAELKQLIPTIILVKLKDVQYCTLSDSAREYVASISESGHLIIDNIETNTNEAVLKTDKNENINDRINMIMFGNNTKVNQISLNEVKEKLELNSQEQIPECKSVCLQPGSSVYMTGFGSLNEIYIRKLEDHNGAFDKLLDTVHNFCSLALPINRPLIIGEIVGAQSSLDDGFYRGKVLNQIDNITYLIQYIDFGDKDNVPISKIYEIPREFMVPSTVLKITLKGIKSNVLNMKASTFITNLLSTCEPMRIDFDPLSPLEDVTLVTINDNANLTECLNTFFETTDVATDNLAVAEKCVTVPEITQNIVEENKLSTTTTHTLQSGDKVCITSYIDLSNIFVRKVDDNNELLSLNERVNTYCSSGKSSVSKHPQENQVIGAKSSADGCFYRAMVIQKFDEENYVLSFIDYGFEETVHVADIVYLPIELQEVPSSITVVGVKGSNFNDLKLEGHEYLESLIMLNELMTIEFDDLNAVTLTLVNQMQNIIDHLNKLHHDDSLLDKTIIDNSIQHTSVMKYISHEISIPQILPLSNNSVVTIYAFVSLKDIYIKVPVNESEFRQFLNEFSEYCLVSKPISQKPVTGDIFGIRSSIDGLFSRALVEEIINENQCRVVFLDLGTEDIVSSNLFVEIPENVKQVPRSIYSVSLKGVSSENLNDRATSYVNMLCENMPLNIEFDENSQNSLSAVTLTTVKTKQNVNYHLAKLLSEKERDSPETVQMLSKGDIVYISLFVDLQTVHVRQINNGTDKFKSFLENFSSCCALESPMENEPKIGEIIAAKEKTGTKFYRAEVISKFDNEHFNVCFIDFGTRELVHKNNIVQPSELQFKNYPPTYIVGLKGFDSEPVNSTVMKYMKKISQTETFIIDFISEQNKVILISVNKNRNINKEIKRILATDTSNQHYNYTNGDTNSVTGKSIVKYFYPPLEIPLQVWVADKLSSSRYLVHTLDSRVEFLRLERLMFEDGKTFEVVKCIKINMPCIVYFSPSWHRGVVLDFVDKNNAKVSLIDVGNFGIIRNVQEIFSMPLKYSGKSLLTNIEVQPEPQEKLTVSSFKIIPKKYMDSGTLIVEIFESSSDESYDEMDNVGLPSFSSTPIPEDSGQSFRFNSNEDNSLTILSETQKSCNLSAKQNKNMLTIKDVQYARWPKNSSKTLTVLCTYQDCLVMRDNLIDDALVDLEAKIQDYCLTLTEPYCPVENELCLAKYCDDLWYRAICVNTVNVSKIIVYFLDWGIEYPVNSGDFRKMSKNFVYLPATAHKCYVKGVNASEWSADTMKAVTQYMLTQVDCVIDEKLSNDSYTIFCDTIKNLVDSSAQ